MTYTVSSAEAQQQLVPLIENAQQGDEIIIADNGKVSVRLVLAEKHQPRERRAGSAKDIILHIAEDFDDPLEDFKEYM